MPETVGAQLKRAREARKLSLEQVFQATRISVRYLQGLENDQPEALPSAVQCKGFLRLYAGFLNLSVQELLDQWEGKTPPEATIEVAEVEEPVEVETLPVVEPAAKEEPSVEGGEAVEIEVLALVEPSEAEPEPPSLSQQIFNDLGAQLRKRRIDLGLSIEEVERFTKLRRHYINALEDGRTTDLPSLVQGRGMLSNYAGFLDLDVEELLLRFADALQQRRAEMLPPEPPPGLLAKRRAARTTAPAATGWRRLLTADVMIGALIIFALVGFGFWGAAQVSALRQQAQAAEATTLPLAEVLRASDTPQVVETQISAPPTLAPNRELGNLPSNQEESSEVTPTGVPVLGDAPLQVYVVARKRAYLRVIVDGKEAFNGRTVAGNAYDFAGDDQVELITGDASALQVFFNQTDLGSLGDTAEVRTLIFNSEGMMVTPTPAFTITPTLTRAPTITVTPTPTQPTPTITPFIPGS